jgi:hypothetical protein
MRRMVRRIFPILAVLLSLAIGTTLYAWVA